MSHFTDIRTQLSNSVALINGLKSMGFEVKSVDIHAAAIPYSNSYNDRRNAHIVARHDSLRNQSTAIGFLWNPEDNVYTLQCDPYEIRNSQYGREFGYATLNDRAIETRLNQTIQQAHDRAGVLLKYPSHQFDIVETVENDTITLSISPKQQLQTISNSIGSAI